MKKMFLFLLLFLFFFPLFSQSNSSWSFGLLHTRGLNLNTSTIEKDYPVTGGRQLLYYASKRQGFSFGVGIERKLDQYSIVSEFYFNRIGYSTKVSRSGDLSNLESYVLWVSENPTSRNLDYWEGKLKLRYFPLNATANPFLEGGLVFKKNIEERNELAIVTNEKLLGVNLGIGIRPKLINRLHAQISANYEFFPAGILKDYDRNNQFIVFMFGILYHFSEP